MAIRRIEVESEEMPRFTEVIAIPPRKYSEKQATTDFGRNICVIEEFGRRILEFKNRGEMIVINVIGPGMVCVGGGGDATKNISFEPFELLNKIREAGIPPEGFKLYVMDINPKVVDAVELTKVLQVPMDGKPEYFEKFFPESHEKEEGGFMPVRIPEEYRKRIFCPEPFDIEKKSAPEKAHITFSLIHEDPSPAYAENLVKSTRSGGYIMPYWDLVEFAAKLGLEQVDTPKCPSPVYRVK